MHRKIRDLQTLGMLKMMYLQQCVCTGIMRMFNVLSTIKEVCRKFVLSVASVSSLMLVINFIIKC